MAAYGPESTVMVRPFVQRHEGRETIIGDPDRKVYLAIPTEGVDILESLAAGNTIEQTVRRYEDKHQETPDIDEFLDILAAEGFLDGQDDSAPAAEAHEHGHSHGKMRGKGLSLNWISPRVARVLISGPLLLLYVATVAVGFGLFLSDPGALPSHTALLFPGGNFAVLLMCTFVLALVGTLVHELAHAVAARASDIPVTLGIGNLLYVLMAQTDITGIQMAPKRRRYLAFVAGTLADMVSASILFMLIYANHHGTIALPSEVAILFDALMYTYLLRMLGQLFFYVRTDLYYLVATVFNCRNLLVDTETLLKNVVRRIFGRRHKVVGQAHIASKERAAIRFYAVVYVVGRTVAFATLFLIFIPILGGILYQFALYSAGEPGDMVFIDFLAFGTMMFLIYGGGIFLWVRSLNQGRKRRRAAKLAAA